MSNARRLVEFYFQQPSAGAGQWKIQSRAGDDIWGDVKASENDGKTYEGDFYPSKEEAEKEMRSFPGGRRGEYRAVPADTPSDVDFYEGANSQNET